MGEKSKYCCKQHVDMAFDDFLVEYETFPVLEEVKAGNCDYCEKAADYILKFSNMDKI